MEATDSRSVFRERASILEARDLRIVLLVAQIKAALRAYMVPITFCFSLYTLESEPVCGVFKRG